MQFSPTKLPQHTISSSALREEAQRNTHDISAVPLFINDASLVHNRTHLKLVPPPSPITHTRTPCRRTRTRENPTTSRLVALTTRYVTCLCSTAAPSRPTIAITTQGNRYDHRVSESGGHSYHYSNKYVYCCPL